ncbi:cysteine-rich with EGF-like domain protein 2 [Ischnura elegans]|uniref:cysteine-rich with EGF-like domain protein 2 n=1 Tax=Ischnura elegans TaxID=197161 RepID=UPI001ED8ABA7|nr:cysteine-rich with EGF-like domain protein 2 [Ischnura elegans]
MATTFIVWLLVFFNINPLWQLTLAADSPNVSPKDATQVEQLKSLTLPPCQACKVLVESFKKGMKATERGKYEGGDSAWEEERLGSYLDSEIRLVEIQEKLCSGVGKGENQCHSLASTNEELIEKWWFEHKKDNPDIYKWLCIEMLKVCCPIDHYGPECKPCPGYPNRVCNRSGSCKGSGTRKGDGKCHCSPGYAGDYCGECDSNYYEAYRDDDKLLCSACHVSCKGDCSKAGPKGCDSCKEGWIMDPDRGCVDINECLLARPVCTQNEFCVNNDGSYSCLQCDRACDGCDGDGPDMCTKCANGYTKSGNLCVDKVEWYSKIYPNLTRYFTYLGLCITTCIIFSKNIIVASLIGLCVAVYISVSEYMLGSSSDNVMDGLDLKSLFGSS